MSSPLRRRPWWQRISAGSILVVSGAVVLVLTWGMYRHDTAFAQRAVTTTGTVQRLDRGDWSDSEGSGSRQPDRAVVVFDAAGRGIRAFVRLDVHTHHVGDRIVLGYDPRNPGHAVAPPPSTAPAPAVYVFGTAGVLLVLLGLALMARRAARRRAAARARRRTPTPPREAPTTARRPASPRRRWPRGIVFWDKLP